MFRDREEELERLNRELMEAEDEEDEEEEEEDEEEEELWDEDEDEEPEEESEADTPQQSPRALIAIVLLVTAGVLLFLAYLLAKREGLL